MKKYKLLICTSAIAAAGIAPIIALASCGNKAQEVKAIPESMLNIESNVLYGFKDSASIDSYNTLVIPENIVAIAPEAFKDAFKEDTNGSTIKTIIFNKNLSAIGKDAFSGCDAITRLDLTKMTDIKIMSLKLGTDSFTTWKNSGGSAVLPEGITDMQKDWIKNLFADAGLPGSWFTQGESQDQVNVDKINNLLQQAEEAGEEFKTMSSVVKYLSEKEVDILSLTAEDAQSQYIWDADANRVVVINNQEQATAKPSSYVLPDEKQHLWKMVRLPSSTKLLSSTNENEPYSEVVSKTTTYSQYLRENEEYDTTKKVEFISGIDAGENKNLNFSLLPSEEIAGEDIVINANDNSSISISTKAADVQVYGNLLSLELDSLEADGNVTTNDKVLGNTIVKTQGTLTVAETSTVQQVIIDTAATGATPTLVVEADNSVAKVTKTSGSTDPVIEADPGVTKPTVDPTPVPTPSLDDLSGMGTEELPYILTCPEDFVKMQSQSRYKDSYHYYKFVCSKDEDGKMRVDASNWGQVGYGDLYGSFDGNGAIFEDINAPLFLTVGNSNGTSDKTFTIKNVTLNCNIMRPDSTAGLIRVMPANAVLKDIKISGYISGGTYAGGVIGFGPGNFGTTESKDMVLNWTFDNVQCDAIVSSVAANGTTAGFVAGIECNNLSTSVINVKNSYFDGTLANTGDWGEMNRKYTYFVGLYLPEPLKIITTYNDGHTNPDGLYYQSTGCAASGGTFYITDQGTAAPGRIRQCFICQEKIQKFDCVNLPAQPAGAAITIDKHEGTDIAIASLIIGPDRSSTQRNYLSTYESDIITEFPNDKIITDKVRNYEIHLNEGDKEGIEGDKYYIKDPAYISISSAYVNIAEYKKVGEGENTIYLPVCVTSMTIQ